MVDQRVSANGADVDIKRAIERSLKRSAKRLIELERRQKDLASMAREVSQAIYTERQHIAAMTRALEASTENATET